MRRWLLLLLVFAAGCRSAADPAPAVTTSVPVPPTTPSTTATTAGPTTTTNPFAVPAVIDLPYVQQVLAEIYRLGDEATRYAYAKKIPDAELEARLVAIFGGARLVEARRILGDNAAEGFVRFADPPGNASVHVVEIVQATPGCMVVRADIDAAPYYRDALPRPRQSVVQLRTAKVQPFNPTGWGIIFAGTPDPGTNIQVCR